MLNSLPEIRFENMSIVLMDNEYWKLDNKVHQDSNLDTLAVWDMIENKN